MILNVDNRLGTNGSLLLGQYDLVRPRTTQTPATKEDILGIFEAIPDANFIRNILRTERTFSQETVAVTFTTSNTDVQKAHMMVASS